MGILDVDEHRSCARILKCADRLISRGDAVDGNALQLARILFKERKTEHAERVGAGGKLLDNEIIILAGFDEGAILTHGGTNCLVLILIGLGERDHAGVSFAPWRQQQFDERVACAAG